MDILWNFLTFSIFSESVIRIVTIIAVLDPLTWTRSWMNVCINLLAFAIRDSRIRRCCRGFGRMKEWDFNTLTFTDSLISWGVRGNLHTLTILQGFIFGIWTNLGTFSVRNVLVLRVLGKFDPFPIFSQGRLISTPINLDPFPIFSQVRLFGARNLDALPCVLVTFLVLGTLDLGALSILDRLIFLVFRTLDLGALSILDRLIFLLDISWRKIDLDILLTCRFWVDKVITRGTLSHRRHARSAKAPVKHVTITIVARWSFRGNPRRKHCHILVVGASILLALGLVLDRGRAAAMTAGVIVVRRSSTTIKNRDTLVLLDSRVRQQITTIRGIWLVQTIDSIFGALLNLMRSTSPHKRRRSTRRTLLGSLGMIVVTIQADHTVTLRSLLGKVLAKM